MLENNHTFDWQNIKIMDFETNYYKRLISEMIYIKTQENGLNSVGDIKCLDSSYFNLLLKIFDQKQWHTKTIYLLIILFASMISLFVALWLSNQLETESDKSNYIYFI